MHRINNPTNLLYFVIIFFYLNLLLNTKHDQLLFSQLKVTDVMFLEEKNVLVAKLIGGR